MSPTDTQALNQALNPCSTRRREKKKKWLGDSVFGVAEVGAGVLGVSSELLLDAEELVVLGEPLGATGSAGLDLSGGESDDEIGDEGVLGLAGAMTHHDAPSVGAGEVAGGDGLGDGADLVDLEEEAVAGLLVHGGLDALGVGDGEIVADELESGRGGHELAPVVPVVLVEGVLDGDDGIVLDEGLVESGELVAVDPLALVGGGVLEVQIVEEGVAVLLHELGGCDVHADLHLPRVSRLLDRRRQQVQPLLVILRIKTSALARA